MKIPSNIIIENNYTIGKEFIYLTTYQEYQGYYYELSNRFFAGKTFDPNAREIIKKDSAQVNKLLLDPKTAEYGRVSKTKLNNPEAKGIIPPDQHEVDPDRTDFYYKKINTNPILIRQVSEQTYSSIKNNPLYIVTYIGVYNGIEKDINDASQEIPELEDWINSDQVF